MNEKSPSHPFGALLTRHQHGVPRTSTRVKRSEEVRDKELREIKEYQELVETVSLGIANKNYTPALLRQTGDLLKRNPEYYTIWNHRRRIYQAEFDSLTKDTAPTDIETARSQILDILQLDLQFLFPLLLKFPKCYWIWNHRLWLLQKATELLDSKTARGLWEEELGLVGKMLGRDSRNFHGWGYRRIVVEALERPELNLHSLGSDSEDRAHSESGNHKSTSLAPSELSYTTKMINLNLSNFSAWHNRTKLLIRHLNEICAGKPERLATLNDELKLIHSALFDPHDASLWAYHYNLLLCFSSDHRIRQGTIMGGAEKDGEADHELSPEERLGYLEREREFVGEIAEDDEEDEEEEETGREGDDVKGRLEGTSGTLGGGVGKWVYQRLIDTVMMIGSVRTELDLDQQQHQSLDSKPEPQLKMKLRTNLTTQERSDLKAWLKKLMVLDPLRMGRWKDLEGRLEELEFDSGDRP